jgi:hypothetical protein
MKILTYIILLFILVGSSDSHAKEAPDINSHPDPNIRLQNDVAEADKVIISINQEKNGEYSTLDTELSTEDIKLLPKIFLQSKNDLLIPPHQCMGDFSIIFYKDAKAFDSFSFGHGTLVKWQDGYKGDVPIINPKNNLELKGFISKYKITLSK